MPITLDLEDVLKKEKFKMKQPNNLKEIFEKNLLEAEKLAESLQEPQDFGKFEENLEKLMFFYVMNFKGKKAINSQSACL